MQAWGPRPCYASGMSWSVPRLVLALFLVAVPAAAWHESTHLAIAKAAGDPGWHHAAAADFARLKAREVEGPNHYVNLPLGETVTAEMVLAQVPRYDEAPGDGDGRLWGAVIASCADLPAAGERARQHLVFCAHYLGDLSQPLHHEPYDEHNRRWHARVDGVVEHQALDLVPEIRRRMTPVSLGDGDAFRDDLAAAVAALANDARALGRVLRREARNLSRDEALDLLARSASLLAAVRRHHGG